MKKTIDLSGVGAGLIDIFAHVQEEAIGEFGFEKGTMTFTGPEEQQLLLENLAAKGQELEKMKRVSGGSVANTIYNLSVLGGKGAFYCSTGADSNGQFYRSEFEAAGIEFACSHKPDQATGACVSLITPDSERTMRTSLCASADFRLEDLESDALERSKWVFFEGYSFVNFPQGLPVLQQIIRRSKPAGTRVALTASEPWVISAKRAEITSVLGDLDLLFTNEHEAKEITGHTELKDIITTMKSLVPSFVITLGGEGAYACFEGQECRVPALKVPTVDLTGAGDSFASGFFRGITSDLGLDKSVALGCETAAKVVSKVGARL